MFDKFARKKMQKLLEQNSVFKQTIDSYKERCELLEQELSQLREERVKECEEVSQNIKTRFNQQNKSLQIIKSS